MYYYLNEQLYGWLLTVNFFNLNISKQIKLLKLFCMPVSLRANSQIIFFFLISIRNPVEDYK